MTYILELIALFYTFITVVYIYIFLASCDAPFSLNSMESHCFVTQHTSSSQNENCHDLLTLQLFKTCMSFLILFNTK